VHRRYDPGEQVGCLACRGDQGLDRLLQLQLTLDQLVVDP
jgi:hypothetical protein